MKRRISPKVVFIVVAVLLIASGLGVWVYVSKNSNSKRTFKEIKIASDRFQVFVQATGQVQPENRLIVKPSIAGRIDEVLVDEGQSVKAGQVLARMSSNDRAALLDMAQSASAEERRHWEEIYKPSPIVAPLSGFVIAKSIERGQVVATSDTAYVISDRLLVQAQVDETDLARVKIGQPVSILLDAYSDQTISGKVVRIAYEARTLNNVTIYDIRVLPDSVPSFMRSGMTASVKFIEETRDDAILVPISLFKQSKSAKELRKPGTKAKLLIKTGQDEKNEPLFEEREVVLGSTDGRQIEVVSGAKVGEIALEETTKVESTSTNPFSPFGNRSPGGRRN